MSERITVEGERLLDAVSALAAQIEGQRLAMAPELPWQR